MTTIAATECELLKNALDGQEPGLVKNAIWNKHENLQSIQESKDGNEGDKRKMDKQKLA